MREYLLVALGAVLGAIAKTLIESVLRQWRNVQQRTALRFVFENLDKPPYLIETEFTKPAPLLGADKWITMTRRCYRIGITNTSEDPIRGVRVVVEAFRTRGGAAPGIMVTGYALRLSEDHSKDSASIPSGRSAMPVFFDLAEQYETKSGEPSDWGWLCFKNTDEPQALLPFGKSLITLRVEAESGGRPQRARFWLQTRTPRADTLAGPQEVRKTKLIVRQA